jgi:hypothetical protein
MKSYSPIPWRTRKVADVFPALAAEIPTDRRSLPEHPKIARILGVENALAVAKSTEKGAPGLLAQHVSIGQTPFAYSVFDDGRQGA